MLRALPALAEPDGTTLLLLHNFHRFLGSPEVVQTAFAQLVAGKQQRTFLVVLAAVVQVPAELEKLFVVLEHALPDREQLERIARELTSDHPEELPQGDDLACVLDAAAGLTRYEAEVKLTDRAHPLRIDYFEFDEAAAMSLRWERLDPDPSPEEVVPSTALFLNPP